MASSKNRLGSLQGCEGICSKSDSPNSEVWANLIDKNQFVRSCWRHDSKVVKHDIEHECQKNGLMQQYATWMCNWLFLNGWKIITIQRCTGLIFTIYKTFRVNTWLISRALDPLTRGLFTEHSYLIKATFRWTYLQFRDTHSLRCHAGMFSYLEPNNSWRNPWYVERCAVSDILVDSHTIPHIN